MDAPDVSVELQTDLPLTIIGVGGDLKSSICLAQGNTATLTDLIGDLANVEEYRRFIHELDRLITQLADRSSSTSGNTIVLAHDLHPNYLSTMAAKKLASKLEAAACEPVQHHHAHVAACRAEHQVVEPCVGIACDGTGYGTDGAVWGCEVLYATPTDFERPAHLQYYPLPGGDIAAKQTWRSALGLAYQAFEDDLPGNVRAAFDRVPEAEFSTVRAMLQGGLNCPLTSSLGRLFDAVAFLAGVCDYNEFEGQAPIRLQEAADDEPDKPYSFRVVESEGCREMVVSEMVAEICQDVRNNAAPGEIASRFHATVAEMLSQAALSAAHAHDTDTVALSGGCFLNRILVDRTEKLLTQGGVKRVLKHERLSPGDASLSLGQAVVAVARLGEKP